MIKTETIKIKKTDKLDSIYIESVLSGMEINPVRWAIVNVVKDSFIVSVSYKE